MPTLPKIEYRFGEAGSRYRLNTPSLILDLDALERNISRMAETIRGFGRRLRPHAKSHKCIRIAESQIDAGAIGICCATLDEAEIMAAGGIKGILITSPLTTAIKIQRLVDIARQVPGTMVVVDDPENAATLARAAQEAGIVLSVLIDVELGFARTGVVSVDAAEALARVIAHEPSLRLAGIQAYGGHLQHTADYAERLELSRHAHRFVSEVVNRLTGIGMPPEIVTGGGTGTHDIDGREGPFTELQAGSYVFMDAEYRDITFENDRDWPFDNALFVQTAVTSTNGTGTVTTDAGTKAFAQNGPRPRISTPDFASAFYEYAGDEHGRLKGGPGMQLPRLGAVIECIVPHCDPTVALYDVFHCVREDRLVDIWRIDARGRR